jgi:hypothetical protein
VVRKQGGANSGRVRSLTNRSINDRRSKRAMSGLALGRESNDSGGVWAVVEQREKVL